MRYQTGFANHFATEALAGALPQGRNSPQRCAYGLYAEQFSGTAFTAPRHANRRSWLYRIRPAAVHGEFASSSDGAFTNRFDEISPSPNPLRWSPLPIPGEPTDFIAGVRTVGGNGSPESQTGCSINWYVANRIRHFLRRRHKVRSRGSRQFSTERVFDDRKVLRLGRRPQRGDTLHAFV